MSRLSDYLDVVAVGLTLAALVLLLWGGKAKGLTTRGERAPRPLD